MIYSSSCIVRSLGEIHATPSFIKLYIAPLFIALSSAHQEQYIHFLHQVFCIEGINISENLTKYFPTCTIDYSRTWSVHNCYSSQLWSWANLQPTCQLYKCPCTMGESSCKENWNPFKVPLQLLCSILVSGRTPTTWSWTQRHGQSVRSTWYCLNLIRFVSKWIWHEIFSSGTYGDARVPLH